MLGNGDDDAIASHAGVIPGHFPATIVVLAGDLERRRTETTDGSLPERALLRAPIAGLCSGNVKATKMLSQSQAAIAAYVGAIMRAVEPDSPAGRKLTAWLKSCDRMVGIDFDAATVTRTPSGRRRKHAAMDKPLPKRSWRRLIVDLDGAARGQAEPDTISGNLDAIGLAAGLNPIESETLRFVLHTDSDQTFGRLCAGIIATRAFDTLDLTAICLDRKPAEIWHGLLRGALNKLNLVGIAGDGRDSFNYFIPYRIFNALTPPQDGIDDIQRRLIGAPMPSNLAYADYAHMEQERDFTKRLLISATATRQAGVNILLYGPPGTGKSEFCKMIAREAGCHLFAVGEADEAGEEPSRSDRIEALCLADRLAAKLDRTTLLFDEMEDVLAQGDQFSSSSRNVRRAGSKVFFNRLLESNQVPVLWTANSIDNFDSAFLRRMTFAFEMKLPPLAVRARMWREAAVGEGLNLPAAEAGVLAQRYRVSPALIKSTARAVAMAGGGARDIDFAAASMARATGIATGTERQLPVAFSTDLANTDMDIGKLRRALIARNGTEGIALCFYGPSGTGKSAFARELAEAMGFEPLLKRGSELLSKWVGGTEARIAEAFEEARQDRRFLILDEAETFFWSRAGAKNSWEATMVNELLVQMEAHPLPFACTTNHLEVMDAAAMRRFSFKVKFDFMSADQAGLAYRRFFGGEPPRELKEIESLTPGDFAVVARKLKILGELDDQEIDILRLLESEVAAKQLKGRKMGF